MRKHIVIIGRTCNQYEILGATTWRIEGDSVTFFKDAAIVAHYNGVEAVFVEETTEDTSAASA